MTRRAWPFFAVPALLGLPAAILAHGAIFGGSHPLGGENHTLVWVLCAAFASAAILAAIAARRVRAHLPSAAELLLSTAAWFASIELREQPHAIPVAQAFALLCLAALAIGIAWRGLTRAAELIVSELSHQLRIATRDTGSQLHALAESLTVAYAPSYRLFSRPPPA